MKTIEEILLKYDRDLIQLPIEVLKSQKIGWIILWTEDAYLNQVTRILNAHWLEDFIKEQMEISKKWDKERI